MPDTEEKKRDNTVLNIEWAYISEAANKSTSETHAHMYLGIFV